MANGAYQSAKRRKELARLQKQEEKRRKRLARTAGVAHAQTDDNQSNGSAHVPPAENLSTAHPS